MDKAILLLLSLLAITCRGQIGLGSIIPCNELHLRATCNDLVCGDYLLSGANTIEVPASTDGSQSVSLQLTKLTGIYNNYFTVVHFWVDSGMQFQSLNLEISYDWTGDGTWDRIETVKPLLLSAGNQRWAVLADANGLQSVNGVWNNLFRGSVQIKMWVIGNSTFPAFVGADSKSYITIPFRSTYSVPLQTPGACGSGSNFPTTGSCNCVAFRLNGVQDFYLSAAQKAILDVFKRDKTPVTLGIIGARFGTDRDLVQAVRLAAQDPEWQVELANNGFNPVSIANMTLEQQEQQLGQFNTFMINNFRVRTSTFIPPANEINAYTIPAMRSAGYTHLSSRRVDDQPPYAMQASSVFRFPAGAFTADARDYKKGVSAQTTWSQIQTQLNTDGFATVSINADEFSVGGTNAVNQSMITELTSLLQMVKTNGVRPVPLSKINTDASNESVSKIDFKNCNCVAFRLDDIQDFFLTVPQKAMIDLFKEFKVPITVGVIGDYFGKDTSIVDYIRATMDNVANNPQSCFQFEVANHGFQHEDFTLYSQSEQVTLLANSNARISTELGVVPKTFIPPFNKFNQDTIAALATQSFTHFSSQVELDQGPYNFENPTLWRFPMGCSTGKYEAQLNYEGVPHTVTWAQIQNQLARDGFATVMMHPQEFSTHGPNNVFENSVNSTMMQELRSLLQTVKQSGMRTVLIGRIREYFTLSNDPCATPVTSAPGTSSSTSAQQTTTMNPQTTSTSSTTQQSSTQTSPISTSSPATTGGASGKISNPDVTADSSSLFVCTWMLLVFLVFSMF